MKRDGHSRNLLALSADATNTSSILALQAGFDSCKTPKGRGYRAEDLGVSAAYGIGCWDHIKVWLQSYGYRHGVSRMNESCKGKTDLGSNIIIDEK